MNQTVNTRNVILDILMEINEKEQYSHIVLRMALKKYQFLSSEDRSFISRVVLGSVERRITLDYYINSVSKVKVNKMKPIIRNILRMSAYQIIYMQGTADFAACNEAVKLAVRRGFATLKGFVNGVLRSLIRELPSITITDDMLSIKYSTPEWLVDKWLASYNKDTVFTMLEAQFAKRPLTIRCNTDRINAFQLTERLEKQGIQVNQSEYLPEALEIDGYDYLDKITEFKEGLFFIQDISSMLVGHVAAPKKDDYVIDVCAAPGGKSMHMAELLKGTGYVEARDLSEQKTELINENIDRLKLQNIAAFAMDAREVDNLSIEKADIVLADLPCSGLGILNKKPDIKYHASEDKCNELVTLQREILTVCSKYVKKGGILIYSTCTVNEDENIGNAKWFEENFPFEMTGFSEHIPAKIRNSCTDKGYLELLPGTENYDGFFIAKFTRK